jgi:hypothetical protein
MLYRGMKSHASPHAVTDEHHAACNFCNCVSGLLKSERGSLRLSVIWSVDEGACCVGDGIGGMSPGFSRLSETMHEADLA